MSTGVAGAHTVPLRCDAPEYAELRIVRRQRVFDAMAAADVDVLILGRPAEVTYATGVRQLWLAGSRPFGPAAILIGSTQGVHLLGTSEDGMPDELGAGDLFAMSWNPAHVRAAVATLPGFADAKVVATTSFNPGFDAFVTSIAPDAAIVDGAALLDGVRRVKDRQEIVCMAQATALAADALGAMRAAVRPGVTERGLLAVYLGRLGELGIPTPPTEGVVCALSLGEAPQLRRLASSRRIAAGDRVVLDVAANVAAYEGGVGTTVVLGDNGVLGDATAANDPLARRAAAALAALVAACRPGASGADLAAAATSTGETLGDEPIVVGIGMGVEPPVIAPGIGDDTILESAMVVAASTWVADETVGGGWYERRLVVVGDKPHLVGPVLMSGAETHRGGNR